MVALVDVCAVCALVVLLESWQAVASEGSGDVVASSVDTDMFKCALINIFASLAVSSGSVSLWAVTFEASLDVDTLSG